MKERHKLLHASYLLIEREDKILLLKRFNTGYEDGKYTLLAGHVDERESFTETIIREAKEEANIEIQRDKIEVIHVNHRPKANYLDIYFKARKWKGKIKNNEPNKCDDLSWFLWDDLPENIIPHVKFALEKIKEDKVYSEFL